MTKQGMKNWSGDKRILPYTYRAFKIPELTKKHGGISKIKVNSKKKLATYVFRKLGTGTYDICIYQRRKGKRSPVSVTAIRFTIIENRDSFMITQWQPKGRKFGVWKRIVRWQDE